MPDEGVPAPEENEGREHFLRRCMDVLVPAGYRISEAHQLCLIAWRDQPPEYLPHPPPNAPGSWETTPRLVAPPPLRDNIPDELQRFFDQALRLGRGGVDAAVLEAVENLSGAWTIGELEAELRRSGTLTAFLDGSSGEEAWAAFREDLKDAWEGEPDADGRRTARAKAPVVDVFVAASDGAAAASPAADSWWKASRWTEEAVSWVDQVGASKVTAVADETKAGIRAILDEAFRQGDDRTAIARAIRALDGDGTIRVGLDRVRGRTFARYMNEVINDPDLSPARIQQLIDRRYNQLLKARAATIAQTEVVQIANNAQVATYQAAAADGEYDAEKYLLEWVARTLACPRCRAMDTSTREIAGGMFRSDGSGPKGVETIEMPELHPRGWCFTRTIRRSEAKRLPQAA